MTGYSLEDDVLPPEVAASALASGGYPYDRRMPRKQYEQELRTLQIELAKCAKWSREAGERFVLVFEGRDAAGKGGTIKRFMQYLNPRHAHVVALAKPTEAERGQWYFQRYITHLPTAGDMTLFDRSWYNRAGVERVMGFCTGEEVEEFFIEAPELEHMLVRSGLRLFKFWLTIGREMQLTRFFDRKSDPLRQWKLSPIDYAAVGKWDDYAKAKNDMLRRTDTKHAPWTVIQANDKRRARLAALRVFLSSIDYDGKDVQAVGTPDPKIAGSGARELKA